MVRLVLANEFGLVWLFDLAEQCTQLIFYGFVFLSWQMGLRTVTLSWFWFSNIAEVSTLGLVGRSNYSDECTVHLVLVRLSDLTDTYASLVGLADRR